MSERFKELVLKTSDAATHRGFESHSLRQSFHTIELITSTRRNTQAGRRGAPAKGVGRVTVARVQIPLSPPKNPRSLNEDFLFKPKGFEYVIIHRAYGITVRCMNAINHEEKVFLKQENLCVFFKTH